MVTQKQLILDYVKTNPGLNARQVAAELGLEANSVSSRLTKLERSHALKAAPPTSGARGLTYSATV